MDSDNKKASGSIESESVKGSVMDSSSKASLR